MISGLSEVITVNMAKPNGIAITCGTWHIDRLTWDEAIGTLAALIVPERRAGSRIGHLRPAMAHVCQDLKYCDLRAYFAPPDFDFEAWAARPLPF